jgi:hypothetical protein
MDNVYSARTPIVVGALEKETDPFMPKEEWKDMLGSEEYTYLNIIDALMYFINNTRSNIAFAVNCLTRISYDI